MEIYIDEDLSHFFLDLSKLLSFNLYLVKVDIVSIDFSWKDSCSELDFKIISEFLEWFRFCAFVLFAWDTTLSLALRGVYPDVGTTCIEDHIEGVVVGTDTYFSCILWRD
jgi:hypothetical protein